MNNLSDDDPQLTNFLRQYRSIPSSQDSPNSPPNSIELENRIMAEIDRLPIEKKALVSSRSWWRILGTIGITATGILGMTIHSIVNSPAPNMDMAELERLDRYLAAHWHGGDADSKSIDSQENLDAYLFPDDDTEDL
jgi:hypothetical protein